MSSLLLADYLHMKNMIFGDWLKRERARRKLRQVDLEEAADLSYGQVSKYERGTLMLPGEDVRQRIHDALGTSDDDLVAAGVLSRLSLGGTSVYVPRNEEDRRWMDEDNQPWQQGQVSPEDVIREITNAAQGVVWTPSMLDAIVSQIDVFKSLQQHGTGEDKG